MQNCHINQTPKHRTSLTSNFPIQLPRQLAPLDQNSQHKTPTTPSLQLSQNQQLTSLRSLIAITIQQDVKLKPIQREKLRLKMKQIVGNINKIENESKRKLMLSPRIKKDQECGLQTIKQSRENIGEKLQHLHKKIHSIDSIAKLTKINNFSATVNKIGINERVPEQDSIRNILYKMIMILENMGTSKNKMKVIKTNN